VPRPTFLGFASSPPAKLVLLTIPATSPYPPLNHSFHFNVEYFHNHDKLPLAIMEQRIREAYEYIENFPDAKIATVARDFEVSRSTLRDRLNEC
jgi:AraC-like DNA-binding protein